jgi:stage II sporulation protein P
VFKSHKQTDINYKYKANFLNLYPSYSDKGRHLMNSKNEKNTVKRTERRSLLRMLLYLAIILFTFWLLLVLFLPFFYGQEEMKENSLLKSVDSLSDLEMKALEDFPVFLGRSNVQKGFSDEPSLEENGTEILLDQQERDEFQPDMKDLLKESELSFKNVDALFENVKLPKDVDIPHSTLGREVVYVYHSHSRESFLPYLKNTDKPADAYHPQANITLVGEMLERALERRGIGTKADSIDIVQELDAKGLEYGSSYLMSRDRVRAAQKANKDLDIFLDIHRDSLRKPSTTIEKNGEKYARLLFVVGTGHEEFEKNLSFTEDLHQQIAAQHPGLSKGILTKDSSQGNGVYNQDIAPRSVIVEVDGVDNTAEELSRTVEVFADVLSDYYWHGEK